MRFLFFSAPPPVRDAVSMYFAFRPGKAYEIGPVRGSTQRLLMSDGAFVRVADPTGCSWKWTAERLKELFDGEMKTDFAGILGGLEKECVSFSSVVYRWQSLDSLLFYDPASGIPDVSVSANLHRDSSFLSLPR